MEYALWTSLDRGGFLSDFIHTLLLVQSAAGRFRGHDYFGECVERYRIK
jgi:hypothetical protein